MTQKIMSKQENGSKRTIVPMCRSEELKKLKEEQKTYIENAASFLGLPKNIRETTALIYRKAATKGLVRGRSKEGVVTAALYAACRKHKVPRTLDEIAEASNVKKREVGRTYRFITRELGIKLLPISPIDYLPRFASELKLSPETQQKAIEILKNAQNKDLVQGKKPESVVAAVIYIASILTGERITQKEITKKINITLVTLRERYKELVEKLDIIEITLIVQTVKIRWRN